MNDFSNECFVTSPGSVIYVGDNILTLRDRFAIAALSGGMSNPNCSSVMTGYIDKQFAEKCYKIADFMLEARKK